MVGEATAAGERAVVARAEARMAAAMAAVATAVGGDGGGVETDARGIGCPRRRVPEASALRGGIGCPRCRPRVIWARLGRRE